LPVVLALSWFNVIDFGALTTPAADATAQVETVRPPFIVNISEYVKHVSDDLTKDKFSQNAISLTTSAIHLGRTMVLTVLAISVLLLVWTIIRVTSADRTFTAAKPMFGVGTGLMFAVAIMVGM